ncbi:MAG: lipopolysaccharide biosynthesis protein [Spirochaetales bacterium]|nr:lipopolysaccharide biosynthesis protein [Spirochaetales bacterium]
MTKLGTPDVVGRFNLGSIIATPIIMFANLQLRSVLATDAKNQYRLQDYVGVRLLVLPFAFLVVLAVAMLGYRSEQVLIIGLFACARCVESLSDLLYGYAQKNERLDLVARSLVIKGFVTLLGFGVTFAVTRHLGWAMVGLVIAWSIPLLFFDLPRARKIVAEHPLDRLWPRWKKGPIISLMRLSLPLGFVMLLLQMRHTVPRTVLEGNFGEGELGIFSALAYLVIVGDTIVQALSQSSLARLAVFYRQGDHRRFGRTVLNLVGFGLVMGAVGVLAAHFIGRQLLTVIYSSEYGAHHRLFVLIMAGGGLFYISSMLGSPATAMRAFGGQMAIQIVTVVLLTGLSLALIPGRGAYGAALVMLGGGAWTALGYGILVWRGYHRMSLGKPTQGDAG